jgi:exopolyphosphatase/guanosine-5'-triphosphate,3'-diphosphate pyrophosphatase
VHAYREAGWDEAVGSSGTAKALADLLELNGLVGSWHHARRLEKLRGALMRGRWRVAAELEGLRPDRIPVLPGGLAIMSAVFKEFGLERMVFSEGALRLGVLYDLLGRYHHDDLREPRSTVSCSATTSTGARRRGSPIPPASCCSSNWFPPAAPPSIRTRSSGLGGAPARDRHLGGALELPQAQRLHPCQRRHARLLAARPGPPFALVLAHRGKLERAQPLRGEALEWTLIFCLRIAVLLHRSRDDRPPPPYAAEFTRSGFQLTLGGEGLNVLPMTAAALEDEAQQWAGIGGELRLRGSS